MHQARGNRISLVKDVELANLAKQSEPVELQQFRNHVHNRARTGMVLLASVVLVIVLVLCVVLLNRKKEESEDSRVEDSRTYGSSDANITNTSCPVDPIGPSLRFRIIVINLDRRSDRLKRFLDEFRGGPAAPLFPCTCRVSAIDGTSHEALENLVKRGFVSASLVREAEQGGGQGGDTRVYPGTLGCYASHWEAMRIIAEDDTIDFGLVAEDDLARYSPVFWSQLSKLWMDSDGEASKLWQRAGFIYMASGENLKGLSEEQTKHTKLIDAGWPKGTALYAVSREAAKYLVGTESSKSNGCIMPIWTGIDSYIPGSCSQINYLRFEPPIASPITMLEVEGDTDVQTNGDKAINRPDENVRNQIPTCGVACKKASSRQLGQLAGFLAMHAS